jgi:hypothetical protein
MAYDPNDPRKSFEYDEFSRRPSVDPAPAGFTGLVIGAIVVLGALIAFLMFRSDTDDTAVAGHASCSAGRDADQPKHYGSDHAACAADAAGKKQLTSSLKPARRNAGRFFCWKLVNAMHKNAQSMNENDYASGLGSAFGVISAVLFAAVLFVGYSLLTGERNPLTSEAPPLAEPIPTAPVTN